MTTSTEKAESLLGIEARRKRWGETSNLSPGERDLVFDTQLQAWRGYLKSQGIEIARRAMTPSQKNAKRTLVEGLAAGLADLNFCTAVLFPAMQQKIRFKQKDLARIYDPNVLAEIVRGCAMNLGREPDRRGKKGKDLGHEFADAILVALKDFYAGRGEKIMVQREIGEMPTWWKAEAGQ